MSKEVVPIGDAAYLAVRTQDLDAELDRLSRRMQAEVVSSFDRRETYALIRISPSSPASSTYRGITCPQSSSPPLP